MKRKKTRQKDVCRMVVHGDEQRIQREFPPVIINCKCIGISEIDIYKVKSNITFTSRRERERESERVYCPLKNGKFIARIPAYLLTLMTDSYSLNSTPVIVGYLFSTHLKYHPAFLFVFLLFY